MNFRKIIYIIILPTLLFISSCAKDSKYIKYLQTQIYNCNFEQNEAEFFTFEDKNNDEVTWSAVCENIDDYNNNECIEYSENYNKNADDWAFTPDEQIYLNANSVYNLSFSTKCSDNKHSERIEVKCGQSQSSSSMKISIMEATTISSESWKTYTNSFSVVNSGYYYIGFHAISYANKRELLVDNIKVTKIY